MAENSDNSEKKRVSPKSARQRAFIAAFPGTGFNASKTCREIGIVRQTYAKWLIEDPKFVEAMHEATEARIDEAEGALMDQVRQGNVTACIFFLKTQGKRRGWIEGSPVKVRDTVSARSVEILDGVLKGEIKPEDAGLLFDKLGQPLPEGLKLLINKAEVTPVPPADGWNQEEVEERLEAEYQQRQAEIAKQEAEWLPVRQEEVASMKEELKDVDSWVGQNPKGGDQNSGK